MVRKSSEQPAVKNIHDVLRLLSSTAESNREKGDRFENLIKHFLLADSLWERKFSEVHLWGEWPGRGNSPDVGIDLVAKDRESGELTAIQCKFYDPDHTLDKSDLDSFFTASGKTDFAARIVVSTTDKWSKHAEDALEKQQVPVLRIRVGDLDSSSIDWSTYVVGVENKLKRKKKYDLRPHQKIAHSKVIDGLTRADRGQLIMACGTGKTFTALKIAETLASTNGMVLFLVPSISLLSQTLKEWSVQSKRELRAFAVCSDTKVGKRSNVSEDIGPSDLAYPATTNAQKLFSKLSEKTKDEKLTVVFSTYQSINVISEAQRKGLPDFDLVICDEAHRTTGVTLADEDESSFVKIHDNSFIKSKKRLYMTATPRIYEDGSKSLAQEANATLASMDDTSVFGEELHRLGFGEAVSKDLLSDYKVLVLAVDESYISRVFQSQLADENHELNLEDAAKIVGCWNGLAKYRLDATEADLINPMKRAVAFARSIKESEKVVSLFSEVIDQYRVSLGDTESLRIQAAHVDGTFNALRRNAKLDWLKEEVPSTENICRVLSNARCLSEGVDVPALDAVIFLNPRNSVVDVVQSVGRVMRKHADKTTGYVILPIGVPSDMKPEDALADNKKYKVVWQVLQALRAHDDRFNAMINQIDLNRNKNQMLQVIGVGGGIDESDSSSTPGATQQMFHFPQIAEWREAIYTKIVQKVGDRRYWEDWAQDVAQIAERHIIRIETLLENPKSKASREFTTFLKGLKDNLNESITREDAIEMLAQHMITKPVFDSIFEKYSFTEHNPVSQVMQNMLELLSGQALDKDAETLEAFYASVRLRAEGIDNSVGKQRIITELYERFFKLAFPRTAERLGIVYTPLEIVDFIINSVEHVLQDQFNSSLSEEGVHILDPFTGTGTFITRLLQSGHISEQDVTRKFLSELHANEIILLAYYIAAINIESTFSEIMGGDYQPFSGIVLTDTFQMFEADDTMDDLVFTQNNERVEMQKNTDIRVVLGNPPYSAGQKDANQDNQNMNYPDLDNLISNTYVKKSSSKTRTSVYDSYFRAFRWASSRIDQSGIVCFVTNGSWIDSNSADGFRKSLTEEFSSIYVFNLRGNQRTQGELSRKEGGKIFGAQSRTPVAITLLVKNPDLKTRGEVKYFDIGDYLSREEKLKLIANFGDVSQIPWQSISPNAENDWINQRDEKYSEFLPLGDRETKGKEGETIFTTFTRGLMTSRDSWSYNFSKDALISNMSRMTDNYNAILDEYSRKGGSHKDYIRTDKSEISWVANLIDDLEKKKPANFEASEIRLGNYRPFTKMWIYTQRQMIWSPYRTLQMFPKDAANVVINITGPGASVPFSALALDVIPNYHSMDTGQAFPLWNYSISDGQNSQMVLGLEAEPTKSEAISNWALEIFRKTYGEKINKIDIFHYVYGILSCPEYVSRFGTELKKMAPRIPLAEDFWAFSTAGKELMQLHIGYEKLTPYKPEILRTSLEKDPKIIYKVGKLRFGKSKDRTTLIFNSHLTIKNIPLEVYDFLVDGKSPLDWIVDRYESKVDGDTRLLNDPNTYSSDPKYVFDLICRLITLSLETNRIRNSLPPIREISCTT